MKPDRPLKSISAELIVLRFPAINPDTISVRCVHCSTPLTLHQPDPGLPERLLGTCERCKHWFLMDLLPDQTNGVLVRLPDAQVIRELSHEAPSGGISLMGPDTDRGSPPAEGSAEGPGRSR